MANNVIYKSPSNPESGPAYDETVQDYSGGGTAVGDNTIENASCDSSVFVGAFVRLSGSTFVNAQANNEANSRVIGICTSKSNSTTCNILTCGFTPSSTLAGLSTGTQYFLSSTVAGQITTIAPVAPDQVIVYVGIGISTTQLRIGSFDRIIRS